MRCCSCRYVSTPVKLSVGHPVSPLEPVHLFPHNLVWQLFHCSTSQHCRLAVSSKNMVDVGTQLAPRYFIIVIICMISDAQLLTHWGRVTQIVRFYITTVQDGWRKSAFLTRACFPCTIHLIMQYIEPVSEWSCWRMFIETCPHSELTFRHRASSI